MKKRISILGCGWLGLPLGRYLVEKGYEVRGSTTAAHKLDMLTEYGIVPFQLLLNPAPEGDSLPDFLQSELLIINIPPSTRTKGAGFHPAQIRFLIDYISKSPVRRVIFISSTSVYADLNREVTEADANPATVDPILEAEKLLMDATLFDTTVLRCGGLLGYNRIPGKYFAGKKGLTTGDIPVNFVHRDDVVRVIGQVIEQQKWNRVFNVVAPQHPLRREVYLKNAEQFGFEAPEFEATARFDYKIVNSERLMRELNYSFIYPDPLHFSYSQLV